MADNTVFLQTLLPRLIIVIVILSVVAAGLAGAAHTEGPRLVVVCDGKTAASIPIGRGPLYVWYNWTHSVERSMIAEKLLATPHGLVLVEARAKSFGAGHPYNSREIGGRGFSVKNGMLVYTANESLGMRIDILAYPDYGGNVTVVVGGSKIMVCPSFTLGTIMVEGRG